MITYLGAECTEIDEVISRAKVMVLYWLLSQAPSHVHCDAGKNTRKKNSVVLMPELQQTALKNSVTVELYSVKS